MTEEEITERLKRIQTELRAAKAEERAHVAVRTDDLEFLYGTLAEVAIKAFVAKLAQR